jgi:Domain of unknown function (DUF4384)
MKMDSDGDTGYLAYVAFLPIVLTLLLADRGRPQALAQAQPSPLSARDLYYEKIEPKPGLKYRILLRESESSLRAVPIDSLFKTNDRVRFEVESNTSGFVYLLQHGSDSSWDILFPSAEVRDNHNRLEPMHPVQIPREQDFVFDQTSGQERVFLVLSRSRETDLERLLNFVRGGSREVSPQGEAPALFKSISTEMSRALASRNLKVYQNSGGGSGDTQYATYAIDADLHVGWVVLELVLNHQR